MYLDCDFDCPNRFRTINIPMALHHHCQRLARCAIHRRHVALVAAFALFSAACSENEMGPFDPDDGDETESAINEIVTSPSLNSTSADTLVYFSLQSGKLVSRTENWDIALRRYEVRLNSPAVAGAESRNVVGFALNNNTNASDAQVLGFTANNQLPSFDNVRENDIPADGSFSSDRLVENARAFLNFSSVPVANAGVYWKTKLSNGAYGLFRVTQITFTPDVEVSSLVIESRLQNGNTLGPVRSLEVTPSGQPISISLVANAVVTAESCNWDLRFHPSSDELTMDVNAECGAGTYPGPASPTFAGATAAADAPLYAPHMTQLVGPIPFSVEEPGAPFRYNLAGNNRLHPTYNIFLVKSGDRVYKFQVIDYYNDAGASGYMKLRHARIR